MTRPILLCTNPAQADALRAHLATAGIECDVVTEIPDGLVIDGRPVHMNKALLPREVAMLIPPPPEEPAKPSSAATTALLFASACGVDLGSLLPAPRRPEPNPDRGRHREKSRRRWERKAAGAKR